METHMTEPSIDSLHFVGVGGIGMSALAQMSASLGIPTTGSDRAADAPENARIFNALHAKGVRVFPQDGSRFAIRPFPSALVYSTAIEESNPDFAAAKGIPRLHRSLAMKMLVERSGADIFAVTGSCGKTTVSAWLAEALDRIGAKPSMISGGLAEHFARNGFAGNYHQGEGKLCVLEADESDKSLLNYTPVHTIVLNIGTDHYSREELARVFREFIRRTKRTAVLEPSVLEAVGGDAVSGIETSLFSADPAAPETVGKFHVFRATDYEAGSGGVFASVDGFRLRLAAPGLHNAANAAAVYAALRNLGYAAAESAEAVSGFSGVWRRFNFAGKTASGAQIYDDYAHNVEKIRSCIDSVHAVAHGKAVFVFQPHGFKPFAFMREELFPELEKVLRPGDVFAFLPVYYAGGTAAFSPTSDEVAAEYSARHPGRYLLFRDRAEAAKYIAENTESGGAAAIMGARDNSLSAWAKSLAGK